MNASPRPPPPTNIAPLQRVRSLFFASVPNGVATLFMLWLLWQIVPAAWRYFVTDALTAPADIEQCVQAGGFCWSFVQDRWRQILFGTFPYAEHWRAGLACVVFLSLIVVTLLALGAPTGQRRMRLVGLAWAAGLALIAALMYGGVLGLVRVPSRLWAGLPLTLMLAAVGTGLGFVLGVALALARREGPPLIRWLAVAYIEFLRGVPLISLLFVASILLPLLLPRGVDVDKLVRTQLAFALFFAAYMAEALRGGLAAVPQGQKDAASALGLGWWRMQWLVVLPQALRVVVPSLVNIFIAAFKDTSLVVVISMMDLLGTANIARSDAAWWGLYIEPYIFIGAIYLCGCTAMAAYSRHIERRMAKGAA